MEKKRDQIKRNPYKIFMENGSKPSVRVTRRNNYRWGFFRFVCLLFQDFLGPEEAACLASDSPDVEFEGMGDYEESIYADWRQPKGKGDAGESNI